jgi:Kef-type K+ transport system membrane component KefB
MMSWLSEYAANPFYEFAILIFLAALFGGLGQMLKQPLIVMFIALGIVVGPSLLDVVQSQAQIHLLAELGIAVLLFIVGLKLDLRLIQTIGKTALLTGLGQVFFTSGVGYFIGIWLGFTPLHSLYIAVALTFSSTIIIVKLLSDKKEIDSLHGQISIGFLIVQDIVVILAMIVLSALGRESSGSLPVEMALTVGKGMILIAIVFVVTKYVLPRLSFFLAKSQELLALFAVAWALSLAALSDIIGFSSEVGAFLAGVSLATSPFKENISSRLVNLRDFLLLFFFVNLGANLDLGLIGEQVSSAMIFSLFVLIGNPIIVLIIMGIMGYRKRTSFLAGLTVAQISEFSLIFAGLGLAAGHLTDSVVGLITLVGLITIGASTYLILYSHQIYDLISPALRIFERKVPFGEAKIQQIKKVDYDVVIFGVGRFGANIADQLDLHPEVNFLGVDFDPDLVKIWQAANRPIIYGDIEDADLLDYIPFTNVKCVVITIPNVDQALYLLKTLRKQDFKGKIFMVAQNESMSKTLAECNIDSVLLIHKMAAENFYVSYLKNMVTAIDAR